MEQDTDQRQDDGLEEISETADEQAAAGSVVALRKELEELNNRYLRLAADYQNYVRRADQSAKDARQQQVIEMAKALVPVLDHFDRALAVDAQAGHVKNVLEGMRIVYDELLRTLERFGVQRIDAKPGEEFDPRRHEALMRQAAEGIPSGHVVTQLQTGYALGDKTLRAAQVTVAE